MSTSKITQGVFPAVPSLVPHFRVLVRCFPGGLVRPISSCAMSAVLASTSSFPPVFLVSALLVVCCLVPQVPAGCLRVRLWPSLVCPEFPGAWYCQCQIVLPVEFSQVLLSMPSLHVGLCPLHCCTSFAILVHVYVFVFRVMPGMRGATMSM